VVKWPCGVCGKDVGSNSVQYISYQKWVHKKCNGIKGSTSKVMKSFICRDCLNPVSCAGHASVDISASENLKLMDRFCDLDDMLSVDEDADVAVDVTNRVRWNKFRQLVHCLPTVIYH